MGFRIFQVISSRSGCSSPTTQVPGQCNLRPKLLFFPCPSPSSTPRTSSMPKSQQLVHFLTESGLLQNPNDSGHLRWTCAHMLLCISCINPERYEIRDTSIQSHLFPYEIGGREFQTTERSERQAYEGRATVPPDRSLKHFKMRGQGFFDEPLHCLPSPSFRLIN